MHHIFSESFMVHVFALWSHVLLIIVSLQEIFQLYQKINSDIICYTFPELQRMSFESPPRSEEVYF
jgi:hypothetical protein